MKIAYEPLSRILLKICFIIFVIRFIESNKKSSYKKFNIHHPPREFPFQWVVRINRIVKKLLIV